MSYFKEAETVVSDVSYISDYMPVGINTDKTSGVGNLSEVVFNPFQRGNGCTLAGYTLKEIMSHTR